MFSNSIHTGPPKLEVALTGDNYTKWRKTIKQMALYQDFKELEPLKPDTTKKVDDTLNAKFFAAIYYNCLEKVRIILDVEIPQSDNGIKALDVLETRYVVLVYESEILQKLENCFMISSQTQWMKWPVR